MMPSQNGSTGYQRIFVKSVEIERCGSDAFQISTARLTVFLDLSLKDV